MKIRSGFVSNSSTSSFICEVSGRIEAGQDLCLSDAEMFECTKGHTVGTSYKLKVSDDDLKSLDVNKDGDGEDDEYIDEDENYDVHPIFCPICQMKKIRDEDMLKYLIKKSGLKRSELENSIRAEFSTFETFISSLK